jgi:hypothetical protein
MNAVVELPQYRCHKVVRAAKITAFRQNGNPGMPDIVLGEIGGIVTALPDWHAKNKPQVGGYYVVYEDGYTSYSPAKAFEEGYAKLEGQPPGWKPIDDMPPTAALCHSGSRWWESPEGAWFCGTCHPTPWLGFGYRHANDRIEP